MSADRILQTVPVVPLATSCQSNAKAGYVDKLRIDIQHHTIKIRISPPKYYTSAMSGASSAFMPITLYPAST